MASTLTGGRIKIGGVVYNATSVSLRKADFPQRGDIITVTIEDVWEEDIRILYNVLSDKKVIPIVRLKTSKVGIRFHNAFILRMQENHGTGVGRTIAFDMSAEWFEIVELEKK